MRAQEAQEEEGNEGGGSTRAEESAGGARAEEAQEERREEREVEGQEGHEGEEEMRTQGNALKTTKKGIQCTNEMMSNRHMTWWRDAWWVLYGQRTTLTDGARPSKSVASSHESRAETRETERVAGREREKCEQGTTVRKESNTLHVVFHFPTASTATSTTATAAAAGTAAAVAATRLQ